MKLIIIKNNLLHSYLTSVSLEESMLQALIDAELTTDDFDFYTSVSSVFSSKIEGEQIELDSYVKHKRFGIEFSPDYTKKTDDLYEAYIFAKGNRLTSENIRKVHQILSRHLLPGHLQGKFRQQNMYVTTPGGKIEYVAASPYQVQGEMKKFERDLNQLLQYDMSLEETFFYASMLHLVFVKIHPWSDGNGRCARLLEKWFIAEKLGLKAWFLQSEKYYYKNHEKYYQNIRHLGVEYPELDYGKALPFLLMLPNCLGLSLEK